MTARRSIPPPRPRRVGAGLFLVGLAGVVAGLLAPLLTITYTRRELFLLAPIDAFCLAVVALAAALLGRRLRASHEDLWRLSRRDELTGVGNYRALYDGLAAEIAGHSQPGLEFALILLDLDRFKEVNEEFGHLEGDRLLARIGRALRDEVRDEDGVFRQGGDEFAVIAPETNGEEAEAAAERLRIRIRGCNSERSTVSAATGFAIFPADGRTPHELLRSADDDLLGTKRNGRAVVRL